MPDLTALGIFAVVANIGCWLAIGLWLVGETQSRGRAADALFVLMWPYHVIQYLRGRD